MCQNKLQRESIFQKKFRKWKSRDRRWSLKSYHLLGIQVFRGQARRACLTVLRDWSSDQCKAKQGKAKQASKRFLWKPRNKMALTCWSKQRSHCIGYSQAKGQNPSAVSIQQLKTLMIVKIMKLSQERCMTTEATTVEHQFKGRNLARTQLQMKIGLELILRIQAGLVLGRASKSPPREDGRYVMQLHHS